MSALPRCVIPLLAALLLSAGCGENLPERDAAVSWPDLGSDRGATPDLPGPDATIPDRGARPDAASPDAASPDAGTPAWTRLTPTSKELLAVACGQGHVFLAGCGGTLLHAGPQDSTFSTQKVPTTVDLHTVDFAVDQSGASYAVTAGKSSDIWESTTWGKSWAIAPQCSAYLFDTFYALHLNTTALGFGAGVAQQSQGGGMKYFSGYSWVCISPTYVGLEFYDVYRRGTNYGFAVGKTGGKVYVTADQGMNWKPVQTPTSVILHAVQVPALNMAVAVGDTGAVLRSSDGQGAKWSVVNSPTTANLRGLHMLNTSLGWAVGDKGTVLHTADGGKSWKVQQSGTTVQLNDVCFTSPSEGWAVGAGGTVLYTQTGGK